MSFTKFALDNSRRRVSHLPQIDYHALLSWASFLYRYRWICMMGMRCRRTCIIPCLPLRWFHISLKRTLKMSVLRGLAQLLWSASILTLLRIEGLIEEKALRLAKLTSCQRVLKGCNRVSFSVLEVACCSCLLEVCMILKRSSCNWVEAGRFITKTSVDHDISSILWGQSFNNCWSKLKGISIFALLDRWSIFIALHNMLISWLTLILQWTVCSLLGKKSCLPTTCIDATLRSRWSAVHINDHAFLTESDIGWVLDHLRDVKLFQKVIE